MCGGVSFILLCWGGGLLFFRGGCVVGQIYGRVSLTCDGSDHARAAVAGRKLDRVTRPTFYVRAYVYMRSCTQPRHELPSFAARKKSRWAEKKTKKKNKGVWAAWEFESNLVGLKPKTNEAPCSLRRRWLGVRQSESEGDMTSRLRRDARNARSTCLRESKMLVGCDVPANRWWAGRSSRRRATRARVYGLCENISAAPWCDKDRQCRRTPESSESCGRHRTSRRGDCRKTPDKSLDESVQVS